MSGGGGGRYRREGPHADKTRLNERIRVPEVRLIDENGEQLGVVKTQEALGMARSRGLDLVEVAPEAKPPVCKILDYGKLKYTKKKKEQEAKKKQVNISLKEIQLRPRIEEHDFNVKYRRMEEFLGRGNKVKVVLLFRGREMAYARAHGKEMMDRLIALTEEIAAPESHPKLEGRRMIMILVPYKAKSPVAAKKKASSPENADPAEASPAKAAKAP